MERMDRNPQYTDAPLSEPYTAIPNHSMEPDERRKLILTYEERLRAANPNAKPWLITDSVEAFKRRIMAADPAVQALEKSVAARDAALKAEQEAAQRKADAALKAEREAALETERRRMLQDWTDAGGTESDFVARWPELKIRLLEERVLAKRNERLAQTAATWRG